MTAACDDSLGPSPSNVLHGNQNDNEGAPHDELPPVEVGSPLVSQQVAQLLLNRIVPREGHCHGLDSLGGGNDILAVPKDILDLRACNHVVGHTSNHSYYSPCLEDSSRESTDNDWGKVIVRYVLVHAYHSLVQAGNASGWSCHAKVIDKQIDEHVCEEMGEL